MTDGAGTPLPVFFVPVMNIGCRRPMMRSASWQSWSRLSSSKRCRKCLCAASSTARTRRCMGRCMGVFLFFRAQKECMLFGTIYQYLFHSEKEKKVLVHRWKEGSFEDFKPPASYMQLARCGRSPVKGKEVP